jgi:branched-chain amino acid transport system substrate-binding protein
MAQGKSAGRKTPPSRETIRVGVVTSLTGPMAGYGTQALRGFQLGLEYATGGTRRIQDRLIEALVRDDGTDPTRGAAAARALIEEDGCTILQGCASSSVALLVARVAEEYECPYVVAPAAADTITAHRNRYVFRTASNTSQDAMAGARYAVEHLGQTFALLAPRTAWGKQTMEAWDRVIEACGGRVLAEIYGPLDTTDFEGLLCSVLASGAEVLLQGWAGAGMARLFAQMKGLGVYERMRVTGGLPDRSGLRAWGDAAVGFVGMFTACSFAAAQAIVQGLGQVQVTGKAGLGILEGMSIDSPKGQMTIRREDHQALQSMYIVEIVREPASGEPTPRLIQEVAPADCAPLIEA